MTGPTRGRLFNLDCEGPVGPYVVEDADFLAWYERWLDEVMAGYDVGWFGERLPLEEPELLAVLTDDDSPSRRARAGESLLMLPAISDSAWTVMIGAMTTDVDATVRAELWDPLKWQRHKHQFRLDNAEAIADDIALYARSCTPPDLNALDVLRKLTVSDVLSELAGQNLQRRRRAAYQFVQPWSFERQDLRPDLLDNAATELLSDTDALLRSYGAVAISLFGLTHLHPRLRKLQEDETDPWVRHHLAWALGEHSAQTWGDTTSAPPDWTEAEPVWTERPPF